MSNRAIISAAIVTVAAIAGIVGWVNLSYQRDMTAARQTEVILLKNGTLMEIYMRRHGRALRPTRDGTLGGSGEIDTVQTEAQDLLLPFGLEVADGWGKRIQYCVSGDLQDYAMVSAGADGKFERPCRWDYPHRNTNDWEADIALHSGT